MKIPAIAILDIGKTNKKSFLFDEQYSIIGEESVQLPETKDEDGFPCEDVEQLFEWITRSFASAIRDRDVDVKAFNVAAYGASFVHLDGGGKVLPPLYNYLKPYPPELEDIFYKTYGGKEALSRKTASPSLGSLNSGLQLYRLKKERPNYFTQVNKSLHLPQFASWAITGQAWSEITSIGCHTLLWDFQAKNYHHWVAAEGLSGKLPPVFQSDAIMTVSTGDGSVLSGVGLHDSSAALIPYLSQFKEPFLLLSTGTWSISLNPFNSSPLTAEELRLDSLCYLDYLGNSVKASRLFAGNEHEFQIKRMADHFHTDPEFYKTIRYDPGWTASDSMHSNSKNRSSNSGTGIYRSLFVHRSLSSFQSIEGAYHQLIADIMRDQVESTRLVMDRAGTRRIFVDGGFSNNPVFMNLLAAAFRDQEVFAASLHQAPALGAALAIHKHWNRLEVPQDLIKLIRFG